MAFLRDIDRPCMRCTVKRAVVELVNRFNAAHGRFCRPCGAIELKKLERIEQNADAIRARRSS